MKPRTASRLAWSIWAVIMALLAAATALTVLTSAEHTDLFILAVAPITILGFATVGALIAGRRAGNPIGWLFLAFAFNFILAGVTDEYTIRSTQVAPGSLPFLGLAVWIQNGVFIPAFAILPLVFLIFPGGRLLSRRWRPVAWAMVAFPAIGMAGVIIRPGVASGTVQLPNPTGVEGLGGLASVLMTIGAVGSIGTALVCVAALVVRYRRAQGDERQQVRWLAYVAATAAVLLLATFSTDFLPEAWWWTGDVLFLGFFLVLVVGIPAASAVAILRYRLYDLDVVLKRTVVFGLLAAFVALAYLVATVGIPTLLFGAGGGVENLIPFLAAAVLAIAFQPVRRWAGRLANRLVYGRRATPYEVLSEFADRVAATYSDEEVLSRMARVLGEGTGAARAEVWVRVGGELRLSASWPPEPTRDRPTIPLVGEEPPSIPGVARSVPVRHRGDLLGTLTVSMPRGEAVTPAQDRLVGDLAGQAGLVLRNVRLIEELRASRQRIVAAQDEERRRLERNIHDGAQQQLVALAVKLRLVESLSEKDPRKAREMAAQAKAETQEALENLRDLARGIYPPLLADKGLAAALESQARKGAVPIQVEPNGIGRYLQEAEAAVYFCVLEALQNVAKYAGASRAVVRLAEENGHLTFAVSDDGRGFDRHATPKGSGLQNMADRLEALGGSIGIESAPGWGTTVTGRIPVGGVSG